MKEIFLDHNATTHILPEVKEAMFECMSKPHNPSSIHNLGRKAKHLVESAKQKILYSLKANPEIYEVIFTSCGTEANNLVINGIKNRSILTTAIEHPSILLPADKTGKNKIIKVDRDGLLDIKHLENVISSIKEGALLSVIYANNETGVIQNFIPIFEIAKKYGVTLHSDASQAYGKIPIDLSEDNFDLLTISGHKFGAPQGVAALIKKKNFKLSPIIYGGMQEFGYRPGTENVPAIWGFGKAAEKIEKINKDYKKLSKLRDYLEEELTKISKDIIIFSKNTNRLPNTSSICFKNINNNMFLIKLDLANIAVSAGSACSSGKLDSSHVLMAMVNDKKIADSTIRISLGIKNNIKEIKYFLEQCKNIINEHKI